jgi:signal transduction histidine kinase
MKQIFSRGQAVDDPDRLAALAELNLLDSLPEESFDRYTRLAAALLRADVSLISLVDSDRQFFKSQVGLAAPYDTSRETPLTHSFCKHVILGEAEQRREEALRMLIHDLRTPAGAIVSSTELIESSPDRLTPDQLELLRTSRESAEQLLSMIRDLLEIGRMGSDETPPPRRTILVSELLRHAAQMVEPTLEAASISLAVRFPDSGSTLEVHPRSVERVLLNLLTNAGKFSPSGSPITLSARRDTIDGIEGWLFEVADAGPGVPDDEKNAVFRQHFTGSIAAERGLQSFGIGLAFCKLAVEEHGGQIGVRDAPGGGSIFFFFLPEKAQS